MQTPAPHRSLLCAKDISVDSADFKDDCESGMDGSALVILEAGSASAILELQAFMSLLRESIVAKPDFIEQGPLYEDHIPLVCVIRESTAEVLEDDGIQAALLQHRAARGKRRLFADIFIGE